MASLKYLDLNIITQGGDSLDPGQHRPLTIPSNLLRPITVRMCGKMTDAAEANGLLGPEHFGFRRGRSTTDAVFVLSTLLMKAKRKRCPYSAAFIDISKVGFVQSGTLISINEHKC